MPNRKTVMGFVGLDKLSAHASNSASPTPSRTASPLPRRYHLLLLLPLLWLLFVRPLRTELGRGMGSVDTEVEAADRRAELLDWLNEKLPDFDVPIDSSEEELRKQLYDGTVLCSVLNILIPGIAEGKHGAYDSSDYCIWKEACVGEG